MEKYKNYKKIAALITKSKFLWLNYIKKNINRFYMYINLLKISLLSTIFINRKHVPRQEMFTWEPI